MDHQYLLIYLFFIKGSLEDQLSRLREYEEAIYQFKPHLEELERINQQIQESFVFENRYKFSQYYNFLLNNTYNFLS